jgi:hypothetical protein
MKFSLTVAPLRKKRRGHDSIEHFVRQEPELCTHGKMNQKRHKPLYVI